MKIFASYSGGRSSALMCKLLKEQYPDAEIAFVFANTGEEHWKTLEFVNNCDKHFGLNLTWVEAKVDPRLKTGTKHSIVTFETASRKGEPFEEVIKKYGIPNMEFPHCTRELKLNPMYSYIKSLGWKKGEYKIAIGIRHDEPKRINKNPTTNNIIYPLVLAGIEKQDVLDFWKTMPFDLGIEEHEGNCKTCWKKSDKKHVLNIKDNRHWYDFFLRMERLYTLVRTDLTPLARVFFRGRRSTQQMLALADSLEKPDKRRLNRSDEDAGCSESCEVEIA